MYCIEVGESAENLKGVMKPFIAEITKSITLYATKVRLTRYTYQELGFFGSKTILTNDDPLIKNYLQKLESSFISSEQLPVIFYGGNSKEFGTSGGGEVYYYRMTDLLSQLFTVSTIMLENVLHDDQFPGFHNPVFYKDDEVVAFVISDAHKLYLQEIPSFESIISRFGIPYTEV